MIELLNEDLAREYQAIIAYVIYSQTIKGAAYNNIAAELQVHAGEELSHALQIARQIDYFGGTPIAQPKEVKVSGDAKEIAPFRPRERKADHCRLSRPHSAGRGHERIRPQRSAPQNHRPGAGAPHRPRRRPRDRGSGHLRAGLPVRHPSPEYAARGVRIDPIGPIPIRIPDLRPRHPRGVPLHPHAQRSSIRHPRHPMTETPIPAFARDL